MSSSLKVAGSQKNTFSPVPYTVQLPNGQKPVSFSFFLAVIPVFVQVLLESISQIRSYGLFSAVCSLSLHTTLPKHLLRTQAGDAVLVGDCTSGESCIEDFKD